MLGYTDEQAQVLLNKEKKMSDEYRENIKTNLDAFKLNNESESIDEIFSNLGEADIQAFKTHKVSLGAF